jgi:E3 ubiquitin-protein ligase NEDD4
MKKGFYKVVPQNLISVFEPFEMEMLLYGVPYIDVKDWRQNTEYKGQYYPTHKVVEWFWS